MLVAEGQGVGGGGSYPEICWLTNQWEMVSHIDVLDRDMFVVLAANG